MKNLFNLLSLKKLVLWLRSYQAPLLGLIIFTSGVVFQSEQFFIDAYPHDMPTEHKLIASFFIAISLEFLIILITINYQHDNDFALNTIFIVYLVVTSYFLDTYLPGKNIGYYTIRAFTSVLIAFMARTYADLLVQKLKEHFSNKKELINSSNKDRNSLNQEIQFLKSENNKLLSTIQKLNKDLLLSKKKQSEKNVKDIQIPLRYGNN